MEIVGQNNIISVNEWKNGLDISIQKTVEIKEYYILFTKSNIFHLQNE
jgi:hypothetical protein